MEDQLILGRYRLIAEAGSGGFATVQLAWDTLIKRRVAIKCIRLDEQRTAPVEPGVPAKMPGLEEAQTAALLSDSSIVGVYDFEVSDGVAYLIMEYVDGMSLTNVLRECGDDIDADVVAYVFSTVAHALEIAHGNQVLHLDIKPDNILINRQGQVKVTDFGLAKLSDAAGFGQAGGGTIGYMPLEQMRLEALDERCDEWALASIAYEMIAGENPFWARDLAAAERAIEDAELVLPSLCMDGIEPEADDVLFCALDPEREERYPTVAEFAEELEPCLGSARRGQKKLAQLVGWASRDDEEDEQDAPGAPTEPWRLVDRIPVVPWDGVMRALAAIGGAVLAGLALTNIPQVGGWTSPVFWATLVAVAVICCIVPHVGALVALVLLALALIMGNALLPGIIVLVGAGAWWWTFGRFGKEQAVAMVTPASTGAISFGLVTPFVIGGMMRPRYAIVAAAWALGLNLVLAGMGSGTLAGWDALTFAGLSGENVGANILGLLARPVTWGIAVGWMAAAGIASWAAERDTAVSVFVGAVGGMAAIVAGTVVGVLLDPLAGGFAAGLPLYLAACGAGVGGFVLGMIGRRFVDEGEEPDFDE
ncbi:serine/threonine-protein kinase [Slackia piriformis]|nr:serine/threonine-protein kinase [Slackia piriformis]